MQNTYDDDIERLERVAEQYEKAVGQREVSEKEDWAQLVYTKAFAQRMETVRSEAQGILLSCLQDSYRKEIEHISRYTSYQPINLIAPVAYACAVMGGKSEVHGIDRGEKKISERGSFSLFVLGETGSGKSTFIAAPVANLLRHEVRLMSKRESDIEKLAERIKVLKTKRADGKIEDWEEAELQGLVFRYKMQEPIFHVLMTPEKLLESLDNIGLGALYMDEGETLVRHVFERVSPSGMDFGSIVNPLLDGSPIPYRKKSEAGKGNITDYAFSIYCNAQEKFFIEAERKVDDFSNKMGRFDILFITPAEERGVTNLPEIRPAPNLDTPLISAKLRNIYERGRGSGFSFGDFSVDIGVFMSVYLDLLRFWQDIEHQGEAFKRIYQVLKKHVNRWGAYARGLEPICKEEELPRALGAMLLLFSLNFIEYFLKGSRVISGNDDAAAIEKELKEMRLYSYIMELLGKKSKDEDSVKVRTASLTENILRYANKKSTQTAYAYRKRLKDLGVVIDSNWGFVEVIDFRVAKTNEPSKPITYDFGLRHLL